MYLNIVINVGLVLVLVSSAEAAEVTDYCKVCPKHTLCKYKETDKCPERTGGGVTASDKSAILAAHNQARQKVASGKEERGKQTGHQPPASNMWAMAWDEELARGAQRWADQCKMAHDACRKVPRFAVGQNIYLSMAPNGSATATWQAAVEAWVDEVNMFNSKSIAPYKWTAKTGHYTQVLWAETYLVGCGVTAFKKPKDSMTTMIYVCNYGPAGNVVRAKMYMNGPGCTDCGGNAACHSTYPALCA